jgi:hypothetical protein
MSRTTHIRVRAVSAAVVLAVAAAIVSFFVSWLCYEIGLNGGLGDRWLIIVPFAPLTGILVFALALIWTRRVVATTSEGLVALLLLEVIAFAIVAFVTGTSVAVYFWLPSNVVFAPSWILGFAVGKAMTKSPRNSGLAY